MKQFSTGGILFLVGTFLTVLITLSRAVASAEEVCPISAYVPLWPG